MAILGHLQAFILVGGNSRKEYTVEEMENEDPLVVTKYVECKSGADFSVQVIVNKLLHFKSDNLLVWVICDGGIRYGRYIPKYEAMNGTTLKIDGVIAFCGTHWEKRPFRFTEIQQGEVDYGRSLFTVPLIGSKLRIFLPVHQASEVG